jgi:hypothetical protein
MIYTFSHTLVLFTQLPGHVAFAMADLTDFLSLYFQSEVHQRGLIASYDMETKGNDSTESEDDDQSLQRLSEADKIRKDFLGSVKAILKVADQLID